MKLEKYALSKEEFESLSKMEQRNYILQSNQEETNRWLLIMAKINVILFFVCFGLSFIAILAKI